MTEAFASVKGNRIVKVVLTANNIGPWSAELNFEEDPTISGSVDLVLGTATLKGTVTESGSFGLQRRVRVIGGSAGWAKELVSKDYHNDAGVKARTIADDAARLAGERIGTFVPKAERIGKDYVRQVAPAARTLEDTAGGAAWWVDYDGRTNVGIRPSVTVDPKEYTVLAYDPRERTATLSLDNPGAVQVGYTISENLDGPHVIRSLELSITAEEMRMTVWFGGDDASHGPLAGLLKAIAQRSLDGRLYGKYKYRVVRMSGDRVEMQSVRRVVGLPDLLPVSMWPGVAGAHAKLSPGAEVLVEFIEGDRAQPIVTHFAGKDGNGFVPVEITLGGDEGAPAARQGDAVECLLPPAVFSGTIGGAPATGVLTFTMSKCIGSITAGSSKVKVAT